MFVMHHLAPSDVDSRGAKELLGLVLGHPSAWLRRRARGSSERGDLAQPVRVPWAPGHARHAAQARPQPGGGGDTRTQKRPRGLVVEQLRKGGANHRGGSAALPSGDDSFAHGPPRGFDGVNQVGRLVVENQDLVDLGIL